MQIIGDALHRQEQGLVPAKGVGKERGRCGIRTKENSINILKNIRAI